MKPTLSRFSRVASDSPLPYYHQVEQSLRAEIEEGGLKPGDELPPEAALGAMFGVSRTVVRQALDRLEQLGFIVKRKGKPAAIAPPKLPEQSMDRAFGFYFEMSQVHGFAVKTRVLEQRVIAASMHLARKLQIAEGAPVLHLERVRSINNEPIVVTVSQLNYEMCPGVEAMDLTDRSLYDTLRSRFGVRIGKTTTVIEAIGATHKHARFLAIKVGAPVFMLHNTTYVAEGLPLDVSDSAHRGDRCKFHWAPSDPRLLSLPAGVEQLVVPSR